jgi:hypothetical protein
VAYQLPVVTDFKTQYPVRDFPYGVPPTGGGSGALAVPTIGGAGNGITSWTVSVGGTGYPANKVPDGIVQYGGGYGATVVVTITAGAVSGVAVANPGYGYVDQVNLPQLYISNGLGDNSNADKVSDFDIAGAQAKAMLFNVAQGIFASQAAFTTAYNLLSAHYLCETLLAAGTGLSGKAEWLTNSKTVGNVTESYAIPDRIMRSPYLSKLSKTTYGSQFLELVSPQLIGNFSGAGLFRFGRP